MFFFFFKYLTDIILFFLQFLFNYYIKLCYISALLSYFNCINSLQQKIRRQIYKNANQPFLLTQVNNIFSYKGRLKRQILTIETLVYWDGQALACVRVNAILRCSTRLDQRLLKYICLLYIKNYLLPQEKSGKMKLNEEKQIYFRT